MVSDDYNANRVFVIFSVLYDNYYLHTIYYKI